MPATRLESPGADAPPTFIISFHIAGACIKLDRTPDSCIMNAKKGVYRIAWFVDTIFVRRYSMSICFLRCRRFVQKFTNRCEPQLAD